MRQAVFGPHPNPMMQPPQGGAFAPNGAEAIAGEQGWEPQVNTAFWNPQNRMRQALGAGLMGVAPAFAMGGQGGGAMGAFGGILPQLMAMQRQGGRGREPGRR